MLIVYSLASGGVSIGALFMAGYIPGILLGIGLMIVSAYYAKKYNYPVIKGTSLKNAVKITISALPGLSLLVVIIGGIVSEFLQQLKHREFIPFDDVFLSRHDHRTFDNYF